MKMEQDNNIPDRESCDPIHMLIVDDHPSFRLGIRQLMRGMTDITVCGEANDGQEAMAKYRQLKPDVVVADIGLPGINGIELTKMIKAEDEMAAILILTCYDEAFYGIRALRAGARGYLKKNEAARELADAVRTIAASRYHLSQRFLHQIIQTVVHQKEGVECLVKASLTDREFELFNCLGQGLGSIQIANKLKLSVKTVETHRAHIKAKLKAETSEDVVRMAKEWFSMPQEIKAGKSR